METIKKFLKDRAEEGLLRKLCPATSRRNGRIHFGNKEYVDLSSNDYLGLSGHPKMIEAAKEAAETYGVGSTTSRLLSGDLEIYHKLEERIAKIEANIKALRECVW